MTQELEEVNITYQNLAELCGLMYFRDIVTSKQLKCIREDANLYYGEHYDWSLYELWSISIEHGVNEDTLVEFFKEQYGTE